MLALHHAYHMPVMVPFHNTSYIPSYLNSKPPKRKQLFTFVWSKLETKMWEFQRMVYLNGEIYDQNVAATTLQNVLISNIAASYSRRTLALILSLSHPNNLSQYTVDGVTHEYRRVGTVVRYS